MTLREKLMHYTYDLDCCSNLKQEAITAIEDIAQYMDEDELLHHSRPLAIAYLALTEDVSAPVVHGRWIEQEDPMLDVYYVCSVCKEDFYIETTGYTEKDMFLYTYCPNCGAKMDGGNENDR